MTDSTHNKKGRLPFLILALIFTILACPYLYGQSIAGDDKETLPPPSVEKFVEATDLIAPWEDSGCLGEGHEGYNEFSRGQSEGEGCHPVTVKEIQTFHRLTIYDSDGSVWYQFSLLHRYSDYVGDNTKTGFAPFVMTGYSPNAPMRIILRMTRESPHWYEVEVNEQTRETKYVLKDEPNAWARTTWSYWLYESNSLKSNAHGMKLLDKPEGKPIPIDEVADVEFKQVKFHKTDGDWAYVEGGTFKRTYFGWIRWRKGREILVGCVFNYKPS